MNANLLAVLEQATDTEYMEGRIWYRDAHRFAARIAADSGKPFDTVVDAIALASPQKNWGVNCAIIRMLADTGIISHLLTSANRAKLELVWHACARLADVTRITGKVGQFAESIRHAGQTDAVCVDSHMIKAFHGGPISDKTKNAVFNSPRLYNEIADAVRKIAHERGERGAVIQARIWVVSRRLWSYHRQDPS